MLLLAAACAESRGSGVQESHFEGVLRRTLGAARREVRFNEVQQKATHNSYGRDETIFDELVYHGVRALEFDLHEGRVGFPTAPRDWFVYHMFAGPYDDTQCVRLSDCLRVVKTFHDGFPQHEVVTLWLDLKDDLGPGGHGAADLDAALTNAFGQDVLFRPRDLMAACPEAKSLRDAVTGACAWPETRALRGKIMVALTGAEACARGSSLDRYLDDGRADRAAFIAPDLDARCTFADYARRQDVVFFNADGENAWRTDEVSRAGLVSRVYAGGMGGGLDDALAWNAARAHRTNFLATDRVNAEVDPWASTHTISGWPFLCLLTGCEPHPAEEGAIVGVSVESGDIDGRRDSFYFLEADSQQPSHAAAASAGSASAGAANTEGAASTIWSTAIAVPSSNVERWAKGCLMARATRDADSPYFAVCRPADNGRIRVQYRLTKGGDTMELEAPKPSGLSAESTFFARLELTPNQDATVASSSASSDGVSWVPIATRTFPMALEHQGLAASSHGARAVRFLFANLKRGIEMMGTRSFLPGRGIGGASEGRIFRGVIP
ncbi:hypothetical protein [Pendulispora albinea]|uniref:Uncharacterized protein n=1 Tax=Pendulispora albinea TaxID=2741071 RepID=A0ABZ2LUH5_9BACT